MSKGKAIAINRGTLHRAVIVAVEGAEALTAAQQAAQDKSATLTAVCRSFVKTPKGRDLLLDELWDLALDESGEFNPDMTGFGTAFHKLRLIIGTVGWGIEQYKEDGAVVGYDIQKKGKDTKGKRGKQKAVTMDAIVNQLQTFAKSKGKNKAWASAFSKLSAEQVKQAIVRGLRAA